MQGRHPELDIVLNDKERKILEKISRSRTIETRLVQRAKIILFASEKKYRNTEIGLKAGCNRDTVRLWKKQFHKSRLDGLKDSPRSGHPPTFTGKERTKILLWQQKVLNLKGRCLPIGALESSLNILLRRKLSLLSTGLQSQIGSATLISNLINGNIG